ncbi:BlaI/MecI/CopY family transcriptional regulator [bacterium]|nr:BlaI/MecI/CopY family transcriptional regulator [bacterium]
MVKPKFHVTDAELEILQILWESERATTREVCDQLYPQATTAQYYTVQKLLERLESRKCVNRDRSQRAHVFTAAIDRDTLIQDRLRNVSDSLCDGALLPMLSGLIKMRKWSASEQKELAQLLKEATAGPKSKSKSKKK